MRGIKMKWIERRQYDARWRRYTLDVRRSGLADLWAWSVIPPHGLALRDNGYPTPEAAMIAAELAARAHFEKTRKRRK